MKCRKCQLKRKKTTNNLFASLECSLHVSQAALFQLEELKNRKTNKTSDS